MKHIYLYLLLALLGLSACNRRVSDYADGMAVYERNGKFGYLDSTGRVAIPARYEVAKDFHDGMAYVSEGGKWGYIDKKGAVVIPIARKTPRHTNPHYNGRFRSNGRARPPRSLG